MRTRLMSVLGPLTAAGLLVSATACCSQASDHAPQKPTTAHTKVETAPPTVAPVAALRVPTDLVGKTLGEAKRTLAKLGFTHLVIAGGDVTNTDKVAFVPLAGKSVPPGTKMVIVGAVPESSHEPKTSSSDSAPNSDSGVQYTCDLDEPVKTDPAHPNEIINRACGYIGNDGQEHSHDPWIEGQLEYGHCLSPGGTWDIPSQSCREH